jgi:uncharacterized protein (UPF0276 family)
MRLSVNHSKAVIELIKADKVHVDAIETVPHVSLDVIRSAQSELIGMDFHYHHGRMLFNRADKNKLTEYLAAAPQSPFISIHLAPLPAYITYPAMRWNVFLPEPNQEGSIKRFVKQVKRLKSQFSTPVILENMPVLHARKYRFESEPRVITRVLDETDCLLLLDLAHARIAAEARRLPVEDYLGQLPLEKTVQVHLAGVRNRDGRLYDAHAHLEDLDYSLLEWVLTRTQPDWITLEYFQEDKAHLKEQLNRLAAFVYG